MQILQGDCIAILSNFNPNSFDTIIADPPYNHPNIKPMANKYSDNKRLIPFEGDNKTVSISYWMHLWMSQCYRVIKPGEFFFCFTDWRRIGETHCTMEAANFSVLGCIVWDKAGTARPQAGRFTQSTEFVLYGVKGSRKIGGAVKPSVYKYFNVAHNKKRHQVEKPVALIEDLLTFCPKGGKILDPFCGSASTGEACMNLGLDFIGVELSEYYVDVARERLRVA